MAAAEEKNSLLFEVSAAGFGGSLGVLGRELEGSVDASVSPQFLEGPEGSKGLGAVGSLLVEVASGPAVTALVVAVQAWLLRHRDQVIKIKVGDRELELPAGADPDVVLELAERLVKMGEESKGDQ